MNGFPSGRDPWHLDVTRHGGKWLAVISDTIVGQTGSDGKVLLAASLDGDTWQVSEHVIRQGPSGAWDDSLLYRPYMWVDGDVAHIYYGGTHAADNSWWIGLADPIPLKRWPDPR